MSEQQDDQIKLDIFPSRTTYQNDFKKRMVKCTKPLCKKQFREPKPIEARDYVIRDNETFANRQKETYIPFNLLWRRKEIVGSSPYESFKVQILPETPGKADAIKTRPRIYMSPAISIDDIDDPKMRDLLCCQMYISETTKSLKEPALLTTEKKISNRTLEKNGDPVRLKVDILPPIPDRYRGNKSKEWERQQPKLTVDSTKTFWKDNTVKKFPAKFPKDFANILLRCGACQNPAAGLVSKEIKQKIKSLISQDQLRLAHDAPIPGYGGYRPRFSGGVSLSKVDTAVHSFLPISQTNKSLM